MAKLYGGCHRVGLGINLGLKIGEGGGGLLFHHLLNSCLVLNWEAIENKAQSGGSKIIGRGRKNA